MSSNGFAIDTTVAVAVAIAIFLGGLIIIGKHIEATPVTIPVFVISKKSQLVGTRDGVLRFKQVEIKITADDTVYVYNVKDDVFNSIKIGKWYAVEKDNLEITSAKEVLAPAKAEID